LRLIPEKNLFSTRKTMLTDPKTQTNLDNIPRKLVIPRLLSANNKINQA